MFLILSPDNLSLVIPSNKKLEKVSNNTEREHVLKYKANPFPKIKVRVMKKRL